MFHLSRERRGKTTYDRIGRRFVPVRQCRTQYWFVAQYSHRRAENCA
jgi:hypothetical protein